MKTPGAEKTSIETAACLSECELILARVAGAGRASLLLRERIALAWRQRKKKLCLVRTARERSLFEE